MLLSIAITPTLTGVLVSPLDKKTGDKTLTIINASRPEPYAIKLNDDL